jgi:pyruvate,orthophosphate dikinase
MVAAVGVLTARGGKTSHAAVVARGMGMCAVVGAERSKIDTSRSGPSRSASQLGEGEVIAIDGATGEVFVGEVPGRRLSRGDLYRARASTPPSDAVEGDRDLDLVRSSTGSSVCRWRPPPAVRANADTPEDAARGPRMRRQGIGLCRTEHSSSVSAAVHREVILAETTRSARRRWRPCCPLQRKDFIRILEAMDGLPDDDPPASTRRCTSSSPTSPSSRSGRAGRGAGQAGRA